MKTKIFSISILALLLLGLLACFTASAANITIAATDPLNGEKGVMPDVSFEAHASITQAKGHPMMARGGTNATGVFVWGNWVGPTTNTTINFPFNASLNNHKYYWTIRANDSYGNSTNITFSFTTEGKKPVLQVTSPADGSTLYSPLTSISGTCDNASAVLSVLFFNLTNSRYWNWAAGNWTLLPLNASTPVGITTWTVTSDMPVLVNGKLYGVAISGNNTYNIGTASSEFTYQTGYPGSHAIKNMGGVEGMLGYVLSIVIIIAFLIGIWGYFSTVKKIGLNEVKNAFLMVLIMVVILGITLSFI